MLCRTLQYSDGYISFIIHLSKSIECTIPKANSNVNYGLWGTYADKFVNMGSSIVSKCTSPVRGVDRGRDYACREAEDIWEQGYF